MRTLQHQYNSTIQNMRRILNMRAMLVAVSALQVPWSIAQPQQYVLDTIGEGIEALYTTGVTSTTDGGTLLHLVAYPDLGLLWKMDQSGEPVWCKHYGISSERRARMPDGGVVFCEITDYTPEGAHLQIVRIDAEGELTWSKLLIIPGPYPTLFYNSWLHVASDEDGNFLISMSLVQDNAYQWFYCLDPDGDLIWSRHFLMNPNADHVQHLCTDDFGGWYFGSYEWGASVFRMGRLNFLGEMSWYNSYEVPTPQEFWLGGICTSEFQAIAVGGYEVVFEEDYRWFLMRLNLNGTLDWFRISATTEALLSQCSVTSAGELLVSSGIQGHPASYVARLSGSGDVISSFGPDLHSVAGTTFNTMFMDWDLLDTTLTMGNLLVTHALGSSEPSYQPAVWRLPLSDLDPCGSEVNALASVLASNSNVLVNDQPYSEVLVPVTITDTVCSVTSFTPIGVSDYCYYFTGIPAVQQATTLGRVLTTLLIPGEPIKVMAPVARCGISVHDAHGRLLYQGQLAAQGNELIPTSAWAPGLYFVRFQPEIGGRPNVVKVVME